MSRRHRLIALVLVIASFGVVRASDAYVLIVHDILLGIQFVAQNEQVQNIWTQVDSARRLWRRLSSALSTGRIAAYTVPETRWREYRGSDDDPLNAYTPLRLALINGDPDGRGYRQVVPPLPADLSPDDADPSDTSRERIATLDRTVRLIDGYSQLAVHQIATNRTAGKATNRVLAAIDEDRRGRVSGSVALLQDIAGARTAGIHDGHMRNITLAYLLESELAEQMLMRDSDAVQLRVDIERRTTFPDVAHQSRAGTTELLRTWRLP
jgi:hypothetical protein